jgi:hypothetical protein
VAGTPQKAADTKAFGDYYAETWTLREMPCNGFAMHGAR